jgi:hypothetical protein
VKFYTILIGAQFTRNMVIMVPRFAQQATAAIEVRAVDLFGGVTRAFVTGSYKNPNDHFTSEMTLRLEIVTSEDPARVAEFARWAGRQLEQKDVLFVLPGGDAESLACHLAAPIPLSEFVDPVALTPAAPVETEASS